MHKCLGQTGWCNSLPESDLFKCQRPQWRHGSSWCLQQLAANWTPDLAIQWAHSDWNSSCKLRTTMTKAVQCWQLVTSAITATSSVCLSSANTIHCRYQCCTIANLILQILNPFMTFIKQWVICASVQKPPPLNKEKQIPYQIKAL